MWTSLVEVYLDKGVTTASFSPPWLSHQASVLQWLWVKTFFKLSWFEFFQKAVLRQEILWTIKEGRGRKASIQDVHEKANVNNGGSVLLGDCLQHILQSCPTRGSWDSFSSPSIYHWWRVLPRGFTHSPALPDDHLSGSQEYSMTRQSPQEERNWCLRWSLQLGQEEFIRGTGDFSCGPRGMWRYMLHRPTANAEINHSLCLSCGPSGNCLIMKDWTSQAIDLGPKNSSRCYSQDRISRKTRT